MIVDRETETDHEPVRTLLLAAFPGPDEADLVDRLRRDGDAVLSLVARADGAVVGHAMLSRMRAPVGTLGLGPVAVLPARRRRGIASRLIAEGLDLARAAGWSGVFVLGDPGLYRRFGFAPEAAAGFETPFASPHFMALSLTGDPLPIRSGRADYAAAFDALG